MNEGLIARRYAKALLKYAQEKDKTFPVYEAARQVEASFIAHLDLQEAMLNPVLTASQKEALMLSAAGVGLLLRERREDYLRPIMLMYQKLYRDVNHIVRAQIVTAAPLDKQILSRIEEVVARHCKDAKLEFEHKIDPEIIGGFVLNVGGEQLDASIEKELKQLRLKLINSKSRL